MPLPAILILALSALAFLGGGIFKGVLFSSAIVLCATATYITFKNRQPTSFITLIVLILLGFLTITVLPLPSAISSAMNQERAKQNELAAITTAEAVEIGIASKRARFFTISRNRSGTIRIILLIFSSFAFGILASHIKREQKLTFLKYLLLLASSISVLGFISQWIVPQGKNIWWFFSVAHGSPVACFVNRNHFGGYLAMLAPTALLIGSDSISKRSRIMLIAYSVSFMLLSIAIISSLSRGALISWITSITFTCLVLLWRKGKRQLFTVTIAIAIAIASLGMAVTYKLEVSERLQSFRNITDTPSASMRITTWKDSINVFRAYPVLGTGANAFRMIFPQHRTSSSRKEFKHTENEYIQLPAETGILGSSMILIIIVCFLWRTFRNLSSDDDTTFLTSTCALGAFVALATHATLDFTIRVPLYLMTFSALAGISTLSSNIKDSTKNMPAGLIVSASGVILSLVILCAGGINCTELDSPDHISTADSDKLIRTLAYAPTSWQAWYHLGNSALASGSPEFGEKCISHATDYNPLNYRLWEQLALVRLSLNDQAGALQAYDILKSLRSWKRIKQLDEIKNSESDTTEP